MLEEIVQDSQPEVRAIQSLFYDEILFLHHEEIMFSEPVDTLGQVRILIIYLIIINKFQITLHVFSILHGAHKLKHSVLPGHLPFFRDIA